MSEVCENHGRIRCGECAYIEELKERISESTIAVRYMAGKWSNNEVIRATYWMPLPEPPKEV